MPGTAPPRPPTTVVVVVRGPSFRAQLRGFLAQDGHRIVTARTTGQALKLVTASPVDWLIADASSGNTLALAIRAVTHNPALKVLLISAEPEYAGRAAVADVRVHFIEKPFAWSDLKRKVDALLELRRGPERTAEPRQGGQLVSA